MNNIRRKKIFEIKTRIELITESLRTILNEEDDYYNNIPENLLSSERAECSEEAIDNLTEAIDYFEEAMELLDDIA